MTLTTPGTFSIWNHTAFAFCTCLCHIIIMFPGYTHAVACVRISFLLKIKLPCVQTTFLLPSSTGGHLDCFHVSYCNTSMNSAIQISLESLFSILLSIYSEVEFLDHMVTLFFNILGEMPSCFPWLPWHFIFLQQWSRVPFFPHPS